jgi:hypothetical protein
MANIKKALALKKYTNPATKVLVEYYKHLKLFL